MHEIADRISEAAISGRLLELDSGDLLEPDSAADARVEISGAELIRLASSPLLMGAAPRRLHIRGALIVGELDAAEYTFHCPLILERCEIERQLVLRDAVLPSLRLPGCCLHRGLDCAGAEVQRSLALNCGFHSKQAVLLDHARIGGELDLRGTFGCREVTDSGAASRARSATGPIAGASFAEATVLSAEALTVAGDVLCGKGFEANGEVRLSRARIGGELDCTSGRFINPGQVALAADSVKVSDRVCCGEGFCAEGTVNLRRAEIGNQLRFEGVTFAPGTLAGFGEISWNLEAARVTRAMVFVPEEQPNGPGVDGPVNMTNARFAYLILNEDALRCGCELSGVEFGSLLLVEEQEAQRRVARGVAGAKDAHVREEAAPGAYDANTSEAASASVAGRGRLREEPRFVRRRIELLGSNLSGFQPQLYEQVAADYRRAGHERSAREVVVAMERCRRQGLSGSAAAWSWLEDRLLGYGYSTSRLLWPLAALLLIGTFFFALDPGDIRLMHGETKPPLWPLIYTVELLVPLINLIQRETFVPTHIGALVALVLSIGGWLLLTLLLAGLTGLLRRGR